MKRRLTLARAMVNDPQVLFLDEPTTGLDPQARHLVWDRLKALLNEGRTIILTTHFMDERAAAVRSSRDRRSRRARHRRRAARAHRA